MSKIRDLVEEGNRHRVFIKNKQGKTLLQLSLTWAVIIAAAVPKAAIIVVGAAFLEIISVELEEIEGRRDSEAT